MLKHNGKNDSIESLVRLASDGDSTAFKVLYEQFHQPVFRTAFRLLEDRMRAEDVTQEVFVSIHQKLEAFDFNSVFKTWCYRITVNACYDVMRKQKRRSRYKKELADPDSLESELKSSKDSRPEEILNRKELSILINDKLQKLHKDLKTTFILREFEQLSYADIAMVMECSEGTVASRLARARKQLAEYLNKIGIDRFYFT